MQFLSLEEPTPPPARRLTRTEALVLSFILHLLIVLLLAIDLTSHLPPVLVAWLAPRPPAPSESLPPDAEAREAAQRARPLEQPKIPLKFAYVKVPNDTSVDKNPAARLLSDKNRKARQEAPTPPDAKRFSFDPHSVGDSIDRVRPDPNRPEGPESPDLPAPSPGGGRGGEAPGTEEARTGQTKPRERIARGPSPPSTDGPGRPVAGAQGAAGRPSQDTIPAPSGEGESAATNPRDRVAQALSDLKAGEYKFSFNNPSYLKNGSYGTLSFDTQDFPWGDYARRLYVVIRNNWLERIPLAAREGIAGYVCQRFVIERSGSIQEIQTMRRSSVPPAPPPRPTSASWWR